MPATSQNTTAETMRKRREAYRDIGEIPPIKDLKRRQKARKSLYQFIQTYQKHIYLKPIADCHKKAIDILEQAIRKGGKFCLALPRGFLKSTMMESAVVYCLMYGFRKYILLIGASETMSAEMLLNIRKEMEDNELLLEDFPEVIYPILKMEGIRQRGASQLYHGERTNVYFGSEIITPTLKDYPYIDDNAGIVVQETSIEGKIRGRKKTLNKKVVRPDLLCMDDLQSRADSESLATCDKREKIINADILGAGSHMKTAAAVCLCTVIRKDDLSDRMLKNKIWRPQREGIIKTWPKEHNGMWRQYMELRRNDLFLGGKSDEATEFYKANREAMDEGAETTWKYCKEPNEISSLQHVYNKLCEMGQEAFDTELMNNPLPENAKKILDLNYETVLKRIGKLQHNEIPNDSLYTVTGIDINLYGISYVTASFSANYSYVIDYGMISDGEGARSSMTDEQYVATLLSDLLAEIAVKPYAKYLNGILIDRAYLPEAVKSVIKAQPPSSCSIAAALGRSTVQYAVAKDARRAGNGWYEKIIDDTVTITCNADVYHLKAQKGFMFELGVPGGCCLFQGDLKQHKVFAQQITSEMLVNIEESGKHIWVSRPGTRHDIMDALGLCHLAAAVLGLGTAQPQRQATMEQSAERKRSRRQVRTTYFNI